MDQRVLSQVVIRIHVDGAEFPSIAAPVADLFGLGLGRMHSIAARWVGMSSGGFYLDEPTPTRVPRAEDLAPWYRIVDTDHQAIP